MFRICHIRSSKNIAHCRFSDRYCKALNTNLHPREISHRYLRLHCLSKLCLLSLRRSQGDFPSDQASARSDVDFRQPVYRAISRIRRSKYLSAKSSPLCSRSVLPCLILFSSSLFLFASVASVQSSCDSQFVTWASLLSWFDWQSWPYLVHHRRNQ